MGFIMTPINNVFLCKIELNNFLERHNVLKNNKLYTKIEFKKINVPIFVPVNIFNDVQKASHPVGSA